MAKNEKGEFEKQQLAHAELDLEEVQRKLDSLHQQMCDLRGRREQLLKTKRQLHASLTKMGVALPAEQGVGW